MNRVEMIRKFAESRDAEKIAEERRQQELLEDMEMSIKALSERTMELINTAKACLTYGIKIYSGDSRYDRFSANGITHYVGFNFVCLNDKVTVDEVGWDDSGYENDPSIWFNGRTIFYRAGTKLRRKIELCKKFLRDFDSFEKSFYEYVDKSIEVRGA